LVRAWGESIRQESRLPVDSHHMWAEEALFLVSEEYKPHSEHGESLKTTICDCGFLFSHVYQLP